MEIFQIEYEELEGRLDPFFYRPEFLSIKHLLESSKFAIKSIFDLSFFVTDGIHKTPKYSENGLIFIQVNNIKGGNIDFKQNIKYVSDDWKQMVLKRYSPKSGDILITKDGTIGIASMVPDKFVNFSIFVSVASIRPNVKFIIPKFLEIMINSSIVQRQIIRRTRGAVLPHLLLEEIRKLLIPSPPFNIQEKVVNLIDQAYSQKLKNDQEAENLYSSINEYLLKELSIKEVSFDIKKHFSINSIHICDKRIDPFYHQPIFAENEQSILNGKYEVSYLNQITDLITSGQRPKGGVRQFSEGIPSLGGEHINTLGFVAQTNLKYIPIKFHEAHINSKVFPKDILLVKDGATTGKVGFVPESYPFEEVNINEHLFLIRIKKKYDPFFVFCYLRSSAAQIQIKQEITGATVTGLIRNSVNRLQIPSLPIKNQKKISTEIRSRIEKAEILKKEGILHIEKAKEEMEKILFG